MHRKQRRPAKRAPAKPSTTALAVVEKRVDRELRRIERQIVKQLKTEIVAANVLTDDAEIGALGLTEVKLTEREEGVLAREVQIDDIQIKPTGQAYLSHPAYTKWFNEAFGRLGWAIVPRSKPLRSGNSVVVPYLLYIHGQPAAFAIGEQEYFEGNREQTFGDAVEATVASALRRVAKRLGVGLELWDKRYLDRFMADRCVKVWRGDSSKPSFRRKDDPPFWDERTQREGDDQRGRQEGAHMHEDRGQQQRRPPAAGHDGRGAEVISSAQVGRLFAIMKSAGRQDEDLKQWLKARYGIESRKAIPRRLYDEICQWVASPGPLPPARLPGED